MSRNESETANISYQEKHTLLKSMVLLKHMPERTIKTLAEFLKPKSVAEGTVIFEEGSRGMSIYFLARGRVRIFKRMAGDSAKELAVLSPGDFFGEMAVIDEVPRSASAAAIGPCLLFELFNGDLARWIKSSPQQAVEFFVELSHAQSRRLRKTSKELTLYFDISSLLSNRRSTAAEFLSGALERVVSHLEGSWSAAAYLAADAGEPLAQTASKGDYRFDAVDNNQTIPNHTPGSWLDSERFRLELGPRGKISGSLIFKAPSPVPLPEQDDLGVTLAAMGSPITTGLEMIALRN